MKLSTGHRNITRFTAVPHYAYLKIKMPGPKGPIMISGDFHKSDKCDSDFNKISQSFGMQEELEDISKDNNNAVPPLAKKPTPDSAFDSKNDKTKHLITRRISQNGDGVIESFSRIGKCARRAPL